MKLKLLLSFLILFSASLIFAGNVGKISGSVIDKETGEGLPFANVFVDGTTMGAASDIDGNYTILNVPPGLYTVTASVVGYQKLAVTDVRVNVDFTTRLNFELSTGSIEMPTVVVQGEKNPLIRQDLTNPTVAITSETIQELPVDQISDVITLQAGITVGDDGSIHIRGGYGNEIAYTVNGVSLNDPYANTRSVGLATNAVQEVSVSSGTFTAEYGNALSGVVNYVTREGGDKFSFSLRGYSGDYLSNRTELFPKIDEFDLMNRARGEFTLGGPIPFTNKKMKLFASGVIEDFNGSLYGQRKYSPTDSYLTPETFQEGDPRKGTSTDPYFFNPYSENSTGLPTGDNRSVAMNVSTRWNLMGNVSLQLSSLIKLKYEVIYDKYQSQGYSRTYKYNPDGRGTSYGNGLIQALDFIHTINQNVFYNLKASYGVNKRKYYLYEDVDDPRYLPTLYRRGISVTGFLSGGTDNWRSERETKTITFKGDAVAQILNTHEVKFGFEARFHHLFYEGYSVEIGKMNPDSTLGNLSNADLLYDSTLTIIRRKPESPSLITSYNKYPVDAAVYVQDKIELAKTLILNVGLRYEYFDPKSLFNPNLSEDLLDLKSGYITRSAEEAAPKHQLSPRLSVSYPITDKGAIRFSYGHFYQNGSLASLYSNHNFYVTNVGSTPHFGNPDVNMQRSIQYELGINQQLLEDLKFDLTGYYKDVRDYIYTQTVYTATGRQYSVLTNLAYSNVRGLSLSFLKRRSTRSIWYATLDYTFQVAEGNRTYPSDELFYSEVSGEQTETYLVPLSFDRSHTVNASFGLFTQGWTFGMIGNLQAGTPYTPVLPPQLSTITFEQNEAIQRLQWNVDLKIEKMFEVGSVKYTVFLQVMNLFDTQNERSVYASTGRALTAVEETTNPTQFNDIRNRIGRGDPGLIGIEEVDGFYSLRPERVNSPREVRLGFSIMFN